MFSSNHGLHDPSENEELLVLAAQEGLSFEEGNYLAM